MVLVLHTGGGAAYSNIMRSEIRDLARKYNSLMEVATKQQMHWHCRQISFQVSGNLQGEKNVFRTWKVLILFPLQCVHDFKGVTDEKNTHN